MSMMINSRIWGQSAKTRRRNKSNEARTTRYPDNKTIMGDLNKYEIGLLGGSFQAKELKI